MLGSSPGKFQTLPLWSYRKFLTLLLRTVFGGRRVVVRGPFEARDGLSARPLNLVTTAY